MTFTMSPPFMPQGPSQRASGPRDAVSPPLIRVERTKHRGQARTVVRLIRQIRGCRWSATMGCWHIAYYANHLSWNHRFKGQVRFVPLHEMGACAVPDENGTEKDKTAQVPPAFIEQLKMRRLAPTRSRPMFLR